MSPATVKHAYVFM